MKLTAKKIFGGLSHPLATIVHLIGFKICACLPDKFYLKCEYKYQMGKGLDLKNPKTFNEKLQWLKLYDRRPLYTTLVDKVKVRNYIADCLGEKYLVPLVGVWSEPDQINFDALPNKFVLKCNHNSGKGMCICKDKAKIDINKVKANLKLGLKENYFFHGREWPYKTVPHRILGEHYMCDDDSVQPDRQELSDFKFYCFNGYVDCVMVCFDRASGDTKFYFFDKSWNLKRINKRGKNAPEGFTLPKPQCLDEMFEIAAELSKNIPFVRVDLYQSNGKVYFGEMTFFPQGGWDPNYLPETDEYFGNLIDLSLAYNYADSGTGN